MAWLGRRRAAGSTLGAVLVVLVLTPGVVSACVLDNTASLWVSGVRAVPTLTAPTDLSRWAPFTVDKAFGSGSVIQLSESRADLARTLSPATLAAPYRWAFGDGTTALGHAVTHRYARPGFYTVVVSGLAPQGHGMIQFDRVLLHIVAPGETLQANLGYYALHALDIAVPAALWLLEGALVLGVLYVLVVRPRLKRRSERTEQSTARIAAQADEQAHERELTHV